MARKSELLGSVMQVKRHYFVRIGLCLSTVIAFLHAGSASAQYKEPDQEQAKKLWEQAIAAKGGRERLLQVNALLVSYQETVRNIVGIVVHRGPVERLYIFPSKVWAWDDGLPPPFRLTVGVLDLERDFACRAHPESKPPVCSTARGMGSREGIDEAQYFYLMETRWIKPAPISVRKDTIGFKQVDVVVTELEGKRIEYYLSRKTHLPQRITIFHGNSKRPRSSFDFSEYVSVNGIQMPGKQKRGKITFTINPAYDAGIFSRLPSIAAGPKAWQTGR